MYLPDPCRWGRRTLLAATPEEGVRQRIVHLLLNHCGWDRRCVSTEVRLVGADDAAARADIVLYEDPGRIKPVFVIECKATGRIDERRTDTQLRAYLKSTRCESGVITDGEEWLRVSSKEGDSGRCKAWLPTPRDLRLPRCLPPTPPIPRGTASRLADANRIRALLDKRMPRGPHLGRKSGGDWVPAVAEFLLHLAHDDDSFPLARDDGSALSVTADLGWRFGQFGNASGGNYDTFFRCFALTSRLGRSGPRRPSLLFQGEAAITIVARSTGITQLTILLEETGKRSGASGVTKHQINIDRSVRVDKPWVFIRHGGKVGGARRGASSRQVVEAVRTHAPDLMDTDGRHVVVARLPLRGPQTWTNGAADTVREILQYCVLRHDYISSLRAE